MPLSTVPRSVAQRAWYERQRHAHSAVYQRLLARSKARRDCLRLARQFARHGPHMAKVRRHIRNQRYHRRLVARRYAAPGPNLLACCGAWHSVVAIPFQCPACARVYARQASPLTLMRSV